jgi:hypothetical protein
VSSTTHWIQERSVLLPRIWTGVPVRYELMLATVGQCMLYCFAKCLGVEEARGHSYKIRILINASVLADHCLQCKLFG